MQHWHLLKWKCDMEPINTTQNESTYKVHIISTPPQNLSTQEIHILNPYHMSILKTPYFMSLISPFLNLTCDMGKISDRDMRHWHLLKLTYGMGPINTPQKESKSKSYQHPIEPETLYHRDDALLYIAYVMLIWAAPIPADRWHCSLWP